MGIGASPIPVHPNPQSPIPNPRQRTTYNRRVRNIRYAVRVLLSRPGFSIVAILTLAPGIGANTAIFAVINAVLLRPLPFRDPSRLVLLIERTSQFPTQTTSW